MTISELMRRWVNEEFSEFRPTCSVIKTSEIKSKKLFTKYNLEESNTTVMMILVGPSTITMYINNLDVVLYVNTPYGKKDKHLHGRIDEVQLIDPQSMVSLKKTIISTVDMLRRAYDRSAAPNR